MIIIRIHGGLGNQMFEYAFYKYMESKYPGLVKADLTWFDRNYKEHQGYELKNVFGIELEAASYEEIARVHEYYPKYYTFAGLRYLSRKLAKYKNKKNKPTGEHIFDFGDMKYLKDEKYDNLDISKDWYLEGVYCSDSYLECLSVKPSELFDFKYADSEIEEMIKTMENEESVAIHIRRGDYVGNVFDIVDMNYYKNAVEIIKSKINNPVFYIFSDDMDYVKENFSFLDSYNPVHNAGKASFTDMMLISKCKHMIIANSSFSYWGAAIGEKEDSVIIAPKRYKEDEDVALARKHWTLIANNKN